MSPLRTGVVATSRKENENRVALHPRHLGRIAPELRDRLVLERGYGERFGVADRELEALGVRLADRAAVIGGCELVLLPKPVPADLAEMALGATLWGWPHCVQQSEVTQVAIDRRLTLLAFEAMFSWSAGGERGLHSFYKNNELAGYCAVLHALELVGWDANYGPPRTAVILGFGSVSRGAAYALAGRGFGEIRFFTQRPAHLVRDQIPGYRYRRMARPAEEGGGMRAILEDDREVPLVDALAEADVVVNGTLQDPERPLMYLRVGEEDRLKPGSVLVDVSCDERMGFPFARPTSFHQPAFRVPGSDGVTYYAVDHTPTYLWDSASWEISDALLPYLPTVMEGPEAWGEVPTLERAVEIRDGRVLNETVLSFQGRSAEYPHEPVG